MSELGKASPEELAAFEEKLRDNPGLIGKVLSEAIEQGILTMPEDSSEGVDVDELQRQLETDEPQSPSVEFDYTAARKAQKKAMLESHRKALLNPKIDVTKER